MPPPNRSKHRRPSPPPAPSVPLAVILQEADQWRSSQNGKPGRGALRDYWRVQDAKHGARPDYQLWRHTQCADSPLERRQDVAQLAVQAVRAKDTEAGFSSLLLTLGWLMEEDRSAVIQRLKPVLQAESPRLLQPGRPVHELARWLSEVATGEDAPRLLASLSEILSKAEPGWKIGRTVNLSFLAQEKALPVSVGKFTRWLLSALQRLLVSSPTADLKTVAAWQTTAWRIQHEAGAPPAIQVQQLLTISSTLRRAGQWHEAVRLTSLALNLLPERAHAALLHRSRVAAWTLAEAGLAAPADLRVSLDDLPFPGEPLQSEKGQETTRLFQDEADEFQKHLAHEATEDPDWQKLRATGVVLNHPLAALAWVGKKAQSYALKKQHELLQAAANLATRYHCLGTLGRILAEWPESAGKVIAYAEALRQSQRRMPVLRDAEAWQSMATCLAIAWGKLDAEAIRDEESIFMLHETLLDREVTVSRCLPQDLRVLALRHLHGRRAPSPFVLALADDPRLMQQLEHQRAVELWSLASEIRERKELAGTVWVSVVMKGELSSGKYSWIIQSSHGRQMLQGRLRFGAAGEALDFTPLLRELTQAIAKLGDSAEWVLLAADIGLADLPWQKHLHEAGLSARVSFIPSWEWAFRTWREAEKSPSAVFEVLSSEAAAETVLPVPEAPVAGPFAQACLLLPGGKSADASTRWTVMGKVDSPPETRRSISLGAHSVILSEGPLSRGSFKQDLTRLSLAQSSALVVVAEHPLTAADRQPFESSILAADPKISVSARLQSLSLGSWRVSGLPW